MKLNRVMQDGTKVRACAAADSFHRRQTLEEHLQQARAQCAALGSSHEVRVSSSDLEARRMKQPEGGSAPSYNVQTTTAAVGKAIVSLEMTQAGNDFKQLAPAIDRLQRTLESKPEQAVYAREKLGLVHSDLAPLDSFWIDGREPLTSGRDQAVNQKRDQDGRESPVGSVGASSVLRLHLIRLLLKHPQVIETYIFDPLKSPVRKSKKPSINVFQLTITSSSS